MFLDLADPGVDQYAAIMPGTDRGDVRQPAAIGGRRCAGRCFGDGEAVGPYVPLGEGPDREKGPAPSGAGPFLDRR
jgi:hypothetical protein